jgi:CheY-like chemotaxis protein
MAATVLYVDDDRNLCQIVGRTLRSEGYEVRTAFDGAEAVASLREDPPDLLLLDLLLPRRDGFEVLEEIRSMPPPISRLPVVLLSGCSPTPAYAERARSLGASELLAKPVPLDKLLEVVVSQIGEPKSMAASRGQSRPQQSRGLAGTLDRIPFPAILHHLHGLRTSGVLHLESGKKRKWIQMRDGYPVAVRSNLMRETLGSFLERTGRITRAILDESLAQLSDGRRHGEILVAMEALTEEQVAEMLREQADGKLFEIFAWESGSPLRAPRDAAASQRPRDRPQSREPDPGRDPLALPDRAHRPLLPPARQPPGVPRRVALLPLPGDPDRRLR